MFQVLETEFLIAGGAWGGGGGGEGEGGDLKEIGMFHYQRCL